MQNFDHNIGFWEKRQFFSLKIVVKTSTSILQNYISDEKFSDKFLHPKILETFPPKNNKHVVICVLQALKKHFAVFKTQILS
jgi:hypothetical protein